jgi:hypothetical protein
LKQGFAVASKPGLPAQGANDRNHALVDFGSKAATCGVTSPARSNQRDPDAFANELQ